MPAFRTLFPVLLCFLPATAAQAGLEFCNNSDETVSVAIGYNDGGTWTSEGWWSAGSGECTTVVGGDLTRRYYYWRATSATHSWERDDQRYMFCTSPKAFTIAGDENCEGRGYRREPFNEIDLDGATSFTMTLNGGGGAPMPGPDAPMTSTDPEEQIEYDEPAAGDPGFGAAPGTFGEPFSITGMLSHCDWYDAGLGCTVLADGWSYVATSYDNTPEDTLVALDGLGVNVPITISGDMISFEGSEALVTIRVWQQAGRDPYANVRAGLQGFWTSSDDTSYQLLIHGASFEEFSGGLPQNAYTMHFREGCPDAPGDGAAFQLIARDGREDRCAFVSGLSGGAIELFVAGTMRPLTFRREN
jgi:uncharacterized membrane protein